MQNEISSIFIEAKSEEITININKTKEVLINPKIQNLTLGKNN